MPFSPCRHFLPPNLVGFYINHLHQEQGTGGRQNNTETKHPLWLPNLLCRLWVSFRMNLVLTTFFLGGDGRGSTIAGWFRIQIATGFNGFCLGFCMFLPKASSTKLPPKVAKVGTFFQSSFRFLPGAPRGRETGETDSSVLGLRNLKTWRTEKHHFGWGFIMISESERTAQNPVGFIASAILFFLEIDWSEGFHFEGSFMKVWLSQMVSWRFKVGSLLF